MSDYPYPRKREPTDLDYTRAELAVTLERAQLAEHALLLASHRVLAQEDAIADLGRTVKELQRLRAGDLLLSMAAARGLAACRAVAERVEKEAEESENFRPGWQATATSLASALGRVAQELRVALGDEPAADVEHDAPDVEIPW